MADYKYSKLGYGRAGDVESAIALGLIDGKDIIITKTHQKLCTSETICLFKR